MDKDEIITQVANDILNTLNMAQIVNVVREHAVNRASDYYENLTDDQKKELEQKIIEAKKEHEDRLAKAEEKQEAAAV